MKNLIATNPEQAKHILANNPMFAVSILRALHTLNIIDDNALAALIQQPAADPRIRNNNIAPAPFPGPPGSYLIITSTNFMKYMYIKLIIDNRWSSSKWIPTSTTRV